MSWNLRMVPINTSSSQTCIQGGGVMRSPLLRLTYFTTGADETPTGR